MQGTIPGRNADESNADAKTNESPSGEYSFLIQSESQRMIRIAPSPPLIGTMQNTMQGRNADESNADAKRDESPSGEHSFLMQSESQRMVESLSRPRARVHVPWASF